MHLDDLGAWFSRGGHVLTLQHAEVAVLMDHQLVWNYYSKSRRGGAANVAFQRGGQVWGVALRVCARSMHGFDRKEGHPRVYFRELRSVQLDSGRWVPAWTYVVTSAYRRRHFTPPSPPYLELLRRGAQSFSLPAHYRAMLDRVARR